MTIVSTIDFGVDYRFDDRFAYRFDYLLDYFLRAFAIYTFSCVGTTLHSHAIDHGLDLGSGIVSTIFRLPISLSAGPWADCRPSF